MGLQLNDCKDCPATFETSSALALRCPECRHRLKKVQSIEYYNNNKKRLLAYNKRWREKNRRRKHAIPGLKERGALPVREGKKEVKCPLHVRALNLMSWRHIHWRNGRVPCFITMKDLCRRLSKLPGISSPHCNIHYSLAGTGHKDRLHCPEHGIQKSWAWCSNVVGKTKAWVIRESEEFKSGKFKECKPNYRTKAKAEARTKGFRHFFALDIKNPRILTLGAAEGIDVLELLGRFPDAAIMSLERWPSVRKEFRKNFEGYSNVKTACGELAKYVFKNPMDYDFLNLDSMGYLSDAKDVYFREINRKSTAKVITVVLEKQCKVRNTGRYAESMRKLYPDGDHGLIGIELAFSNYEVVEDYEYDGNSQPMRMFVLVRR